MPCTGSNCDTVTPVYPSEIYCPSTLGCTNGSQPAQPCSAIGSGAVCYSSHEVSNIASYPNYPSSASPWYGITLMYYVELGGTIKDSIADGCLVISAANSPTELGWTTGNGPSSCAGTFPTGNAPLPFSSLTSSAPPPATGVSCATWGEPAIMIAAPPSGVSGTAVLWLAAACFDNTSTSRGYYFFYTTPFNSSSVTSVSWTYYSGPFTLSSLPSGVYQSNGVNPANTITELDLAVRADSTMVAVITPEYFSPGPPASSLQYGCAVVNLDLYSTANPFPSLVATVNDMDGSTDIYEFTGPNGCTYEPKSNTGVVIVRHDLNTSLTSPHNPAQYQTYALIDTGVLP